MNLLTPEEARGLPQEKDKNFDAYVHRMRMLLNTRAAALTTDDPIPLYTIVATRFIPTHGSRAVRIQVRTKNGREHVLDPRRLRGIIEQGFLPDPEKARREDVLWNGVWYTYFPQLYAVPKS